MDNNNVPVGSAPGSTESVMVAAVQALGEKNQIIAERDEKITELERMLVAQQQTVNGQRRTIAQRDATIAEHRHASTEHQRTIAERDVVIAELKRTITERNAKIARISEHSRWLEYHSRQVTTMATAAVAAHNSITLGNGAPPGNVGPDEDAPSRDDAAPRDDTFPRDDNAAMSDESSGDDLDNAATGADDDDLVDAASGADDTTAGDATGAAATDDAASGADDDVPADEIAESLHVAKRRRLNQQALEYMHPFVLIGHDVLAEIFNNATGRQLVPAGGEPRRTAQELAGLEPFTCSIPQRTRACSSELAGLHLLRRSNVDLETLRTYVLRQLGVAERPGTVVLGPVLCYVLVTLCGIRLEQMSGEILDKIFRTVTSRSLRSLLVVTDSRPKQMAADKLCALAKVWVQDLCKFIVEEGGTGRLQEAMTQCNDSYERRCNESGHSSGDPKGAIAKMVLSDDSNDSNIFLGLDDDAYDLEVLCKSFFAIAGGSVDQDTAAHLRQVADS